MLRKEQLFATFIMLTVCWDGSSDAIPTTPLLPTPPTPTTITAPATLSAPPLAAAAAVANSSYNSSSSVSISIVTDTPLHPMANSFKKIDRRQLQLTTSSKRVI